MKLKFPWSNENPLKWAKTCLRYMRDVILQNMKKLKSNIVVLTTVLKIKIIYFPT